MTTESRDGTSLAGEQNQHVEMEIVVPPGERDRAPDGRRRSVPQRLRLLIVVAALVVAVVVLATSRSRDASSTPPPHDGQPKAPASSSAPVTPDEALDALPQGPPPAIPFLRNGNLHADGITFLTRADRLLVAGDTLLVGRSDGDSAQWQVLDRTDLVPVPELEDVFTPYLSPLGDVLAWTSYPDEQTTRITAWQPSTRAEVGHLDLAAPYAECCGGGQEVEILGFDLREQVYFTDRHGYQVWRPGTGAASHRLTGVDSVAQLAPGGPVRQGGALGRVDAHGHWSKVADLPTDQGMVWSADGRLLAYGGDGTGAVAVKEPPTDAWVLDRDTGRRTHLALPAGIPAGAVAFESDRWVLVDAVARPRRHYLLRCAVSDGACERALPPGRPTWVFPERSYF
jgi:hypothetical protein